MATYEIKAPNGKTYQLEGPEGATKDEVIQALLAKVPEAATPIPPRRDASLLGEIQKAGERMFVGAGTAISGLGSEQDAATAGVEALRRQQELEKKYGESPSLARVMETYKERGLFPAVGQAVSDFPSYVAQQVPNLAAMYAGAKAGALAGMKGGPKIAAIGAGLGALSTLVPTFAGENIAAQAREDLEQGRPVEIDRAKAYGTAAVQAGTEAAGTVLALGSKAVRSILKLPAETPLANKGLEELLKDLSAKTLAKGAVRGAAVEMPVELAQSVLQRWQAGQDLLSDDALMDYGESLYGALMIGTPLGTLGRYTERSQLQGLIGEKQKEESIALQAQKDEERKAEQEARQFLFRSKIDDLTRPELEQLRDQLTALPDRAKSVDKRLASVEAALEKMPQVEEGQEPPTFGQVKETLKPAKRTRAPAAAAAPEAPVTPTEPIRFGPTDPVTPEILQAAGLPALPKNEAQTSLLNWFDKNVVGKTQEDLIKLKEEKPGLFKGKSLKARVLNELLTPETAAPVETVTQMPETAASAVTTPQTEAANAQSFVTPQTDLGGTEPSVGVSGERGAVPAGEPAAPDAGGVVSPSVLTEQGNVDEGALPPAVTPTPTPEPIGYEGYAPQGREKQLEVLAGDINAADDTIYKPKNKHGERLEYISFGAPDVNGPGLGGYAAKKFYDSLTEPEKLRVEQYVGQLRRLERAYATQVRDEAKGKAKPKTKSPAPKDMTLEGVLKEVKEEEKQAAKAAEKEVKEVEKLVKEIAPKKEALEKIAEKEAAEEKAAREERKKKLLKAREAGLQARLKAKKPIEVPPPKKPKTEEELRTKKEQEQRDQAEEHAFDIGGDLVWQEGDIGLIRITNPETGKHTYAASVRSGRIKTDIRDYEGTMFTPQQKKVLVAQVKNAESVSNVKFGTTTESEKTYSAKALTNEIKSLFRVDSLGRNIVIVDSPLELQGRDREIALNKPNAFGWTGNNRVIIIAGRIRQGEGKAKFLHEVGGHLGFDGLLTAANKGRLFTQIGKWIEQADDSLESRIARAAGRRVKEAGTAKEDINDELIAYFIEEAIIAGVNPTAEVTQGSASFKSWFRTLWASFKNAIRRLGMRPEALTPQDIVDMAFGAARLEVAGTWHGTAAYFRKFNHEFMGSGEGAQAFGWGSYLAQRYGIAKEYWAKDVSRKTKGGYFEMADGRWILDGNFNRALRDAQDNGVDLTPEWLKSLKAEIEETQKKYLATTRGAREAARLDSTLEEIESALQAGGVNYIPRQEPEGSLMRVDTLIEPDELLNWDTRVGEQSKLVQKALLADPLIGPYAKKDSEVGASRASITGEDIYKKLRSMLDSKKAVSEYLDRLGIKGIKFLDARSRGSTAFIQYKGKKYTLDDLRAASKATKDTPERLGFTLLRSIRHAGSAAQVKAEYEQKVAATEAMLIKTSEESRKKYFPEGAPQYIIERSKKDVQDYLETTHEWRALEWLKKNEGDIIVVDDTPTRNIVVFDDQNIFRVGAEVGAVKERIKFSVGDVAAAEAPVRAGAGSGTTTEAIAKDELDAFTKARFFFADKAAPVFQKLGSYTNGVVRDALGDPSVELVYRQGEAADQLIPEFLRRGFIKFNNRLGVWETYSKEGVAAPVEITEKVRQWGASKGLKFDAAWEKASKLLQAARENEFRKANAANAGNPNARKFPITLTNADFARLFDEYTNDPEIKALNDLMDKPRLDLIDRMVEVGRISKEKAQEWKDATAYVPFDRLEKFGEIVTKLRPQKSVGRGLAALGRLPELVDAMYVDRPVKNVLENYLNTLGWMMQQTVKTSALNRTIEALTKLETPRAKFLGYVSRPALRNAGLEVAGYKKGKKVYYQVDSVYDAAAFNVEVAPMPKFMQVMQQFSRVLRTAITALPTFTAGQLPQDIQRAIMFSGVKDPVELTARILNNMKSYGKAAVLGKLYQVTGNLGRTGIIGDVDFRGNNPAESILQELGVKDRSMLKSKKFGEFVHRLNEIARASDAAVRQGIYEQTIKETGDEALAMARAREIINFRTYGAGDPLGYWHFLVQTVPFMNAYAQGTDVLARNLTGKSAPSGQVRAAALAMFWRKAAYLMAANSIYALAFAGEEEYENMELEKRDKIYMIGSKDGVGFGIPVASEIGMLFKAIPERVIEAMRKTGTPEEKLGMEAVLTWFKAAFNEYAGRISPVPIMVKPALEALTNFSFRTYRPIEGIGLKELDPSQRVTFRTSELAQHIAQWTKANIGVEVSPTLIDNTLSGYLGTSAAFGLMVGDQILNPDRTDRPLYQMVGLTPFTYAPVGTRYISEFYDLRDKVVRAQNTLNRLAKTDLDGAQKYYEDNKERLAMFSSVNSLLNELQKTRAYKQYLMGKDAEKDLPSDERANLKEKVEAYEQEQSKALLLAREMLKP